MNLLLKFCALIDDINTRFGTLASWAIVLSCFISCGNALIRFGFSISSNAWLEIQWYLFALCVMLGASLVLRLNEHVRVDIFYGQVSSRAKVYVDIFGLVVFLLPVMGLMAYLALPEFLKMFANNEMSTNAGGLIRWPAMMLLPLGFFLVFLQGLSETIKRVAWLRGEFEMNLVYERPLQ
jgi:TRAP-type mannitol/chloroaromatic compound transport system permease small subunit